MMKVQTEVTSLFMGKSRSNRVSFSSLVLLLLIFLFSLRFSVSQNVDLASILAQGLNNEAAVREILQGNSLPSVSAAGPVAGMDSKSMGMQGDTTGGMMPAAPAGAESMGTAVKGTQSTTTTTGAQGATATGGQGRPQAPVVQPKMIPAAVSPSPAQSHQTRAGGATGTVNGGGAQIADQTTQQQALSTGGNGAPGVIDAEELAEEGKEKAEGKEGEMPKLSLFRTIMGSIGFAIVCVAAFPLAMLFPALLRLPIITGYLLIGVMAGPFLTNLLQKETVMGLAAFVNNVALSFIAFQAGQELYWPDLKPHIRNIGITLGVQYVTILSIMTGILSVAAGAFFYGALGGSCSISVALLFASIGVAISPATALAIQIELKSAGPFTNLMIGMVMISDFLVLVTFSVARIVASLSCTEKAANPTAILVTFAIVLSNLLIGALFSFFIVGLFSLHHPSPKEGGNALLSLLYSLPVKGVVWMVAGFGWFTFTEFFAEFSKEKFGEEWEIKFEKLLVLMIASCIAGHKSEHIRHDMHVILDTAAPYVFLPFFTMTGAAMKLDQVAKALPLSLTYVAVRWFALIAGTFIALKFILKKGKEFYTNLWMCFTPQAGVTLGLANEVQMLAPDTWGPLFAATIVGAVVIAQLFGPVLCSLGVKRSGEAGKMLESDGDDHHGKKALDGEGGGEDGEGGAANPQKAGIPLKIERAAVIGASELAFSLSLHLCSTGAKVRIPALGNSAVRENLHRFLDKEGEEGREAAKNIELVDEVLSLSPTSLSAIEGNTDAVIFLLDDPERTKEYCQLIQRAFPDKKPRLLATVKAKEREAEKAMELHRMGVMVIRPNLTVARFASNLAEAPQSLACDISLEACGKEGERDLERGGENAFLLEEELRFMGGRRQRKLVGRGSIGRNMMNMHGVDSARASRYVAQVFGNRRDEEEEEFLYPPPPNSISLLPVGQSLYYRPSGMYGRQQGRGRAESRTSYVAFGVNGGRAENYRAYLSPRESAYYPGGGDNRGAPAPYGRGSIAFNAMSRGGERGGRGMPQPMGRISKLVAEAYGKTGRGPPPPPPAL